MKRWGMRNVVVPLAITVLDVIEIAIWVSVKW
jgi:hypothetical protein